MHRDDLELLWREGRRAWRTVLHFVVNSRNGELVLNRLVGCRTVCRDVALFSERVNDAADIVRLDINDPVCVYELAMFICSKEHAPSIPEEANRGMRLDIPPTEWLTN